MSPRWGEVCYYIVSPPKYPHFQTVPVHINRVDIHIVSVHNITMPRPRSYTPSQLEQALRLLASGTPIRTVAALTNLTQGTIQRIKEQSHGK